MRDSRENNKENRFNFKEQKRTIMSHSSVKDGSSGYSDNTKTCRVKQLGIDA